MANKTITLKRKKTIRHINKGKVITLKPQPSYFDEMKVTFYPGNANSAPAFLPSGKVINPKSIASLRKAITIKMIRKLHSLTQLELSKRIGVSVWTVKAWECGRRECSESRYRLVTTLFKPKTKQRMADL